MSYHIQNLKNISLLEDSLTHLSHGWGLRCKKITNLTIFAKVK